MDVASITAVFISLFAQAPGDRQIDISLLKGTDCSPADTSLSLSSCKSKVAAEMMIDGKVIATMPLDALTDEEVARLSKMLGDYTMVSREALAEAQKLANKRGH